MLSYNSITVLGHSGSDIDIKYTNAGLAYGKFSIAYNAMARGDQKPPTTWFSCTVWGKQAEFLAGKLRKGGKCMVVGTLQEDRWINKEGIEQKSLSINAQNVNLIDFIVDDNTQVANASGVQQDTNAPGSANGDMHTVQSPAEDDIPF